jgi:hypothetical protein
MIQLPHLLLLSLLVATAAGCSGGSSTAGMKRARTADDYQPRTLRAIAANGSEAVARGEADGETILIGDLYPSHVRVMNTGATRDMPDRRKELIRSWANRFAGAVETYTLPYQTEYLFVENGVEYWIAVRTQSLPDFEQSFKNGEPVELNLIRLGGIRTGGNWEWVMLVESFEKTE